MAARSIPSVILLVDDDPSLRNLARRVLESAGFLVLAAANAAEALALSRACRVQISALVTDIEMPEMDGVTLAHEITRERPDTSVLLMSGGMNGPSGVPFIAKPFSPTELADRLKDVIDAVRNKDGDC